MMRALFFVLALIAGTVWADECSRLPPSSITLKRFEEPVSFNTTHNYKSITVLASTEYHSAKRVLGLTRGDASISFEIKSSSITDSSGRWECISPQITVRYGFSPMTVYVASEFPKGSCAYNEVIQHELRHVKTYQDHLAGIERDIAEALTRRFATDTPWRGPVGQSFALLEKEMHERWMPYIKRQIGRVESAQALIDTPEEYTRVSQSCGGEIQRLTR
ncbi:MAG: hypothetical protein J0653_06515 [Deltaproteobacteria bacterium]|nr:hypothetical protein [Deltaproteobacteria bacterium]